MASTVEGGGGVTRGLRPRRSYIIEVAVIAGALIILAALIFPLTIRDYPKAWMSRCEENQKQIALAILEWSQSHDEALPQKLTVWSDIKGPLHTNFFSPDGTSKESEITTCPARAKLHNGYVYNSRLSGRSCGDPSIEVDKVFMIADGQHTAADGKPTNIAYAMADLDMTRHSYPPCFIATFADGHAEEFKPEEAKGWLP